MDVQKGDVCLKRISLQIILQIRLVSPPCGTGVIRIDDMSYMQIYGYTVNFACSYLEDTHAKHEVPINDVHRTPHKLVSWSSTVLLAWDAQKHWRWYFDVQTILIS